VNPISSWDERYLALAGFISSWSKDPSTQVGAVITDTRNRIVSVGFNGMPVGVADTFERLNDRELKYKMIVHAERNAMLFAQRSLDGCTLYTVPFMPCSVCAGMVVQAGIKRVVAPFVDNSRWNEAFRLTEEIFAEAGVKLDLVYPEEAIAYG
jgi:dCMP deaminase